jgi:hypothetical protein
MKRALALTLVALTCSLATPGCYWLSELGPCNGLQLGDELLFTVTDVGEGDFCDLPALLGLHVGQEMRFVVEDFAGNKGRGHQCLSAGGPIETDWPRQFTFVGASTPYPFGADYDVSDGTCNGVVDLAMVLGRFGDNRWQEPIPETPTPAAIGFIYEPRLSGEGCRLGSCGGGPFGTLQKIKK